VRSDVVCEFDRDQKISPVGMGELNRFAKALEISATEANRCEANPLEALRRRVRHQRKGFSALLREKASNVLQLLDQKQRHDALLGGWTEFDHPNDSTISGPCDTDPSASRCGDQKK